MTSSARLAAIRAGARPAIWRRGSADTANPSSSPECRDAARRETAPPCRSAARAKAGPSSAGGCRAASRPALAEDTRRVLAPARGSPDRARDRRLTHRAGAGPPASPPRAHWRQNFIRHVGLRGQLPNRRDALVELAVQLAGKPRQQSQRAGAFDLGREIQPAAAAFGIELGVELEVPKRAVLELALLGEPAIFLPLAEPLVRP